MANNEQAGPDAKKMKMDKEETPRQEVLRWDQMKKVKECYNLSHNPTTKCIRITYDPNGDSKANVNSDDMAAILAMQTSTDDGGKKTFEVNGLRFVLPALVVRFQNTDKLGYSQVDKNTGKVGKPEFTMTLESRGYEPKFLKLKPNIESECIQFYYFVEFIKDLIVDYMLRNPDAGTQTKARTEWTSDVLKNPTWTNEQKVSELKKKLKTNFQSPIVHKVENGKEYIEVKVKQSVFFEGKIVYVDPEAKEKVEVKRDILGMRGGKTYADHYAATGDPTSGEIIKKYVDKNLIYTPLNMDDTDPVKKQRAVRNDPVTMHGSKTNIGSIIQVTMTLQIYIYMDKQGFMGLFNKGLNLYLGIEKEKQAQPAKNMYTDYEPDEEEPIKPLPPIINNNDNANNTNNTHESNNLTDDEIMLQALNAEGSFI